MTLQAKVAGVFGTTGLKVKRAGAWVDLGASADPMAGRAIGDPLLGGFFAGVIDTTVGNIIAADASQVGQRYALIVSPKSLQSTLAYKTSKTADLVGTRTRWDGLTSTAAMASDAETYPAAGYCAGLTYPTDGGSPWYLPAMDELEILYRNLKATAEGNFVGDRAGETFPGVSALTGENISSDPAGVGYTSGSPAQTPVALFRSGAAEALGGPPGDDALHRSSTEMLDIQARIEWMSGDGTGGYQSVYAMKDELRRVRPVRRLVL